MRRERHPPHSLCPPKITRDCTGGKSGIVRVVEGRQGKEMAMVRVSEQLIEEMVRTIVDEVDPRRNISYTCEFCTVYFDDRKVQPLAAQTG